MTDDRPRPQYGEYATPEQQHAAKKVDEPFVPVPMSVSAPTASASAPTTPSSSAPDQSWPGPLAPVHRPQQPGSAPTPPAAAQKPARRWDLIVSAGLLGYGLFSVISRFPIYSDLVGSFNRVSQLYGLNRLSPSGLATTLGIVINASSAVIWIITAWITYRLLRRGRLSFYVPLIGGVLVTIIIGLCAVAIGFGDPSLLPTKK